MKNAIRGCSFRPCLFEESLQLCDQLKGSQLHRQHCLFRVIGCLAQCKDTFDHAGGVVCCHVWTDYSQNPRIPSFSSSNVWSRHCQDPLDGCLVAGISSLPWNVQLRPGWNIPTHQ